MIASAGGSTIESPRMPVDTPRSECDLNRSGCRDHPFRVALRKRVAQSPRVGIVVDVHSFDRRTPTFSPHELVVLDDAPRGGTFPTPYVASYARFVAQSKVDVVVIRGAGNDIVQEMRGLGVPAFLLEFNEGLSQVRMQRLTGLTAKWLKAHVG